MQPTLGRIVHYVLSEQDAQAINKRRADFAAACEANGGPPPAGWIAHVGNTAVAGQYFPAKIVAIGEGGAVNLQVALDGTDIHWATSRAEGSDHGTWRWPPRV